MNLEAQGTGSLGERLTEWTASPLDLVRAVLMRSSSRFSQLHGERHWLAVAHAGLIVARATSGADPRVALLFGLFHDAMRVNEYDAPEHGARGAALLRELIDEGVLRLPTDRAQLLTTACELHSDGLTHADPTIGACWDADRLNVWRLGWTPSPSLMSTADARSPERIAWARDALKEVPSWTDLFDARW